MIEDWISQREFGRRRGVTHRAVAVAISSKRIAETSLRRDEDGRIVAVEWHSGNAAWNGNTDPDQATRAGAPICVPAAQPLLEAPDPAAIGADVNMPLVSGDDALYLAARRRKMESEAKQSELDYLMRVGALVSADDVRVEIFKIHRKLRDALSSIPERLSPRLAAETDPVRVQHLIGEEIRKALDELSRALAASAGRTDPSNPGNVEKG